MAASLVFRTLKCLTRSRQLFSSPLLAQKCSYTSDNNREENGSKEAESNLGCTKVSQVHESKDIAGLESMSSRTRQHKTPTEGALDKFAKVVDSVTEKRDRKGDVVAGGADSQDTKQSFASMLRKSKLVSLGEHSGRLVEGKIIETTEDDLYIDFGGKFHCVCPRPRRRGEEYQRGSKVLLDLQCLEMSSAFLGSDIHITLLEADATLVGLMRKKEHGQYKP